MNTMRNAARGFYREDECDLAEFASLVSKQTSTEDCPTAEAIEKNIPVYDANALVEKISEPDTRRALIAEWAAVFLNGAGVLAIKNASTDMAAIDEATAIYQAIIVREKEHSVGEGDHFAKAGANDRIWNSLQKLCEASPAVFARYFANPAVDAVCEAWLGPDYQMTAQVNLVHPGGEAQQAHRDYHLGFQSAEKLSTYPAHVHDLSPLMTLQGAIAHCDMPIESGPTKLLPYSQLYRPGYAAYRRSDFQEYFEQHHVQLPLAKGDALFFNPALFHAAGANTSADIQRLANLLQISSPFGRSIETVNRRKMSELLYPALVRAKESGTLSDAQISATIAACGEGYSFPTNLDSDPPIGGMAPETQAQLMHRALMEGMTRGDFVEALDAMENRRKA